MSRLNEIGLGALAGALGSCLALIFVHELVSADLVASRKLSRIGIDTFRQLDDRITASETKWTAVADRLNRHSEEYEALRRDFQQYLVQLTGAIDNLERLVK